MKGFETQYKNIIDYIVRITYTIWEEKNIGYIYDTYSPDCRVWDEFGLQSGSEKIVSDTVHTNNAFPDIRLFADEVIWAGDENISFHTSHRTIITGTNTGFSKFSKPTGKAVSTINNIKNEYSFNKIKLINLSLYLFTSSIYAFSLPP